MASAKRKAESLREPPEHVDVGIILAVFQDRDRLRIDAQARRELFGVEPVIQAAAHDRERHVAGKRGALPLRPERGIIPLVPLDKLRGRDAGGLKLVRHSVSRAARRR